MSMEVTAEDRLAAVKILIHRWIYAPEDVDEEQFAGETLLAITKVVFPHADS